MPQGKSTTKKTSISPINKTVIINAGIDKVWTALTDSEAIGNWTDDDEVKTDLKKGGKYGLFAGYRCCVGTRALREKDQGSSHS